MKIFFIIITTLSFLSTTEQCWAQSDNGSLNKLQEIEKTAIESSNVYKRYLVESEYARKKYNQTYYTLIPNVTLTSSSSSGSDDTLLSDVLNANYLISYNLMDLVFLPSSLSVNEYSKNSLGLAYKDEINSFRASFRGSLLRLASDYYDYENRKSVLDLEQKEYSKAKRNFNLGAGSRLDFYRAKSSYERNKNRLEQVKASFDTLKANIATDYKLDENELQALLNLLKKPDTEDFMTGDHSAEVATVVSLSDRFKEQLIGYAVGEHLALLSSGEQLKSLESTKTANIRSYLPNVAFVASGSSENDTVTYGLNLSLSFPAIIKDTQHFKLAKKNYETNIYNHNQKVITKTTLKDRTLIQIERLQRDFRYAAENLKTQSEIFELSKQGYRKGQVTSRAYVNDLKDYVEASTAMLKAKYSLLILITQTEQYMNQFSDFGYFLL